jgi:formamidopyrimidine-DNA glycosylase
MPELPEVETIKRGITPYLEGKRVKKLDIRERRLRWQIVEGIETHIVGSVIKTITRRAKYLLFQLDHGNMIVHLGMSGSLRILPIATPPQLHDHIDLIVETGVCLRLRDPRRLSCWLWHPEMANTHKLLKNLGPEPLESGFDSKYLFSVAAKRRIAIKLLIMNSNIVSGVGNIYASESLFLAGIHPQVSCKDLTLSHCEQLVKAIKTVLIQAIAQGGTTLRDFSQADGKPGYFANKLQVYGRANQPCVRCQHPIQMLQLGQRMSFFCPQCQPSIFS